MLSHSNDCIWAGDDGFQPGRTLYPVLEASKFLKSLVVVGWLEPGKGRLEGPVLDLAAEPVVLSPAFHVGSKADGLSDVFHAMDTHGVNPVDGAGLALQQRMIASLSPDLCCKAQQSKQTL